MMPTVKVKIHILHKDGAGFAMPDPRKMIMMKINATFLKAKIILWFVPLTSTPSNTFSFYLQFESAIRIYIL
jgi:hypothetical protein